MNLHERFWPENEPTQEEMRRTRGLLLVQGALAAVMYNLGTGNFMAGYLSTLGATAAQISQITLIPQLGCVLQLVSPLFFERFRHRKAPIVLLCFLFRFLMGFTVFAPLLFVEKKTRLFFVLVLYSIAFLAAGFVTPALNQWIVKIAPTENRGVYYSRKDIIATVASSAISFVMGYCLDACTAAGNPMKGFVGIYGFCIIGSVLDLVLLSLQCEPASTPVCNINLRDLLQPLRQKSFRPVLIYEILGYISAMFSSGFLAVYQLNVLGLSYTFLTTVGIFCSVLSMAAIYFWGRVADCRYWTTVLLGTKAISAMCCFFWWLLPVRMAPFGAPVIMALSAIGNGAAGMAGVNLQYDSSPPAGKTTYLGVTAALASLAGYAASLVGGALQHRLEPLMGGKSIALLFGISGMITLAAWLYGKIRLPKAAPMQDE